MAFSTGGYHGLAYAKETTFGELPAVPAMEYLRHTSSSLILSKDSFQSAELRHDGQISDLRLGANQVSGDIGIELSYGEYDDFLAAAVRGTWSGQTLKAGTTTPTFSIESIFADISQYQLFTGCAVNTFSLSIQPNAMVTGTIGFVGRQSKIQQTSFATSNTTSQQYPPLDGYGGSLKEGGNNVATVTSIELTIDNGITPAFVIGSPNAVALIPARINVTGTLSAYFTNLELLNKFINETESKLEVILGANGINTYTITLPRIKYMGGSNSVSDESAIQLDMPFQALYDSTTATNIMITKSQIAQGVTKEEQQSDQQSEQSEQVTN